MADPPVSPVPQFATAEYADAAQSPRCEACKQPLGESYYRVNGRVTCAACAGKIQERFPKDSHAAFVRGILFGAGGAVLGLILYVTFALITGLVIGFVSLAVGYLVGKAIIMGSAGRGGRRYQVVAVLLTYAAVSLSAVPIAVFQHAKQDQVQEQSPGDATASVARVIAANAGELVVMGLASPFLDLSNPTQGLIGLVILFVGLRIAWKLTAGRQFEITGPLREALPAPPG